MSENRSDCVVKYPEPGVAQVILDQCGKSANVLSRPFQIEIEKALNEIDSKPEIRIVILSSAKPTIFVAGADLNAIVDTLDWSDDQIMAFCEFGQKLYHRFQQREFTSVAAIHGACVGGGMELALGCDYRIASSDRRTIFGLPETKLGLIPGWAGTVRLPRMMQPETAIELIASGRLYSPAEAKELGIIDAVVDAARLTEFAIEFACNVDLAERNRRRQRQLQASPEAWSDPDVAVAKWSRKAESLEGIYAFAPKVLSEHMIRSASLDFENACHSEARAMAVVYGSEPSHGLLNNFFLGEHAKKSPGTKVDPAIGSSPQKVGIIGCGLMGESIARLLVKGKFESILYDSDPMRANDVAGKIGSPICAAAERFADLATCDLVLEAVTEKREVKAEVLQQLAAVNPDCIVASNTSTIPVHILGRSWPHPDRLLGVHFCHPLLLELVEIIPSSSTSDTTVATAVRLVRNLKKTGVVVGDSPGFVVNRMLMAIIDEATGLVGEGADWYQIDQAMQKAGMLAGPFEIADEIGIDTLVLGAQSMAAEGIEGRYRLPLMTRMLKHKRLGRKNGGGFYDYREAGSRGVESSEARRIAGDCIGANWSATDEEIVNRILLSVLMVASELLFDGVAAEGRDLDLCLIRGLGFPAHLGGILFWADRQGPEKIQQMFRQCRLVCPAEHPLNQWLSGNHYFYPHGNRTRHRAS